MATYLRLFVAVFWSIAFLYILVCACLFPLLGSQHNSFLDEDDDDGREVLADFFKFNTCSLAAPSGNSCQSDGKFVFGVATAPAHVEDKLNDSWLEFAKGHDGHYPVRAWLNVHAPENRLKFWTQPEVELLLAKELGVTAFRLGVDWGRIIPVEPLHGVEEAADKEAVEHYKWILRRVHDYGMKVMLTLFHHSLPKWALQYGGWTDQRTIGYFTSFAEYAKQQFGDYVDYWVTFNEPHIFVLLTHCSGTWPPGSKRSTLASIGCFTNVGEFGIAMKAIGDAHIAAYKVLHQGTSKSMVGVAHHVGVIKPYGFLDIPIALSTKWLTEFQWIDQIQNHLDFCGINYYGQEILSAAGLMLVDEEEYSEAGRGVYPDGLLEVLNAFHKRYRAHHPSLKYIITENGFADSRDLLRRPYLLEHLLAAYTALKQGIPLEGYFHWTLSDNWEWADGYCPKFGLVAVDRIHELKRHPRPSYYLYQQITKTGLVTRKQREREWNILQSEIKRGGSRPFCRAVDDRQRMWADGLDKPTMRAIAEKDWRFGKSPTQDLIVYVLRSFEVIQTLILDVIQVLGGRANLQSQHEPMRDL
ncbi:hypothetical protein O6H91_13G036400 [Diphasiastrum complanatum]|uniref:Uncharacterized protein n=1 Tax=Diphasiastrum complanatum TaxID=34168 RepID=A0ACC2BUW3_DIPCM|nr:hypothetical protein O6H91_13G036400 [Diphasiastrum complanatum]